MILSIYGKHLFRWQQLIRMLANVCSCFIRAHNLIVDNVNLPL